MILQDVLVRLQALPAPSGAIEKIFGQMLYGAIKTTHPQTVLELGTGQGYSTAWMLLGLMENEAGHLWTADILPADNPVWNLLPAPHNQLTYWPNDPIETLQDKLPPSIDFIFHDSGHSWAEVETDLKWLLPKLSLNGSIVIHDVVYSREMGQKLLEYFDSNTDEWKYEQIEEGCGVGIATRIKLPEVEQSCKDVSSGSMTSKATVSSKAKTRKITLPTSLKSKAKSQAAKRYKKTKTLFSSRHIKNKRGPEQNRLLLSSTES